jgi:hypothetical protein
MAEPKVAIINIDGMDLDRVSPEMEGPSRPITDLDLPPEYRTQANLWKSKYFEAYKELVNANKGLRRLQRRNESLKRQLLTVGCILSRADQAEREEEAKRDEQI